MDFTVHIAALLKDSAAIAHQNFQKTASETVKPGDQNQVLTETDLAISHFLVKQLQQHYPDHNIIDEEAGVIAKGSNFTWVLDPIDGTSNFAVGLPTYGIMIGLLKDDQPFAGGVALPYFNDYYVAQRGEGTSHNGQTITIPTTRPLSESLIGYGIDSHLDDPDSTDQELKVVGKLVAASRNLRISNSVYDLMQVVHGRYAACLNQSSRIWDNVAQQIVIEEAGGVYTDYFGKPMNYTDALDKANEHFTYCTATASIHQELQTIIATT